MKSNPVATFIVPVYNGADFIAESIESIISQTFQNWTLLILDNCSTDNTQEVCASYLNDTRIQYIRNEKNLGLLGNLLKGIELTQTPYWCYVCHDDKFIDNTAVQRAFDILEADPEIAMVSSPLKWMDARSNIIYDAKEPVHGKLDADQVNRLMLRRIRITYGVIMLARTQYVKSFQPDVKWQSVADVDLFISISQGKKVYIYKDASYAIRFHNANNSMRTFSEARAKYILIADKYNIQFSKYELFLQYINNIIVAIGKKIFFAYLAIFRK